VEITDRNNCEILTEEHESILQDLRNRYVSP